MTDTIEIPTANLRLSTTASSKKGCPQAITTMTYTGNQRWNYGRQDRNSNNRSAGIFGHGELDESVLR